MTQSAPLNRALLIVVALLGWLGILLQLWVFNGHSAWAGIVQALCYFTVLTNILVTLIATHLAWSGARGFFGRAGTLAAAAVYIAVVGLIYALVLSSLWAPTGLHKLADAILHSLIPVLYVLWWLLYAPKKGLRWTQPLQWLAYPLAYFAFSVGLGALTGRYLYPFADLGNLPAVRVLRNAALLLLLVWGLGIAAVALARWARARAASAWRRRRGLARMAAVRDPRLTPAARRAALKNVRTTIRGIYGMAHQSHHRRGWRKHCRCGL
jgi:hypothetical protein